MRLQVPHDAVLTTPAGSEADLAGSQCKLCSVEPVKQAWAAPARVRVFELCGWRDVVATPSNQGLHAGAPAPAAALSPIPTCSTLLLAGVVVGAVVRGGGRGGSGGGRGRARATAATAAATPESEGVHDMTRSGAKETCTDVPFTRTAQPGVLFCFRLLS